METGNFIFCDTGHAPGGMFCMDPVGSGEALGLHPGKEPAFCGHRGGAEGIYRSCRTGGQ